MPGTKPPSRLRALALRWLLVVGGVVLALLVAEVGVRLYQPWSLRHAAQELWWFRENAAAQALFTTDPDFGFRPILDTKVYDAHGILRNDYSIEKKTGRARVLFIGDSVTARGVLIAALRARYGDDRFEYWNAGVESFNTVQEALYYERYNRAVAADHVVLTFHYNDFETTPVVFRDGDGRLVVHAPHHPIADMSPFWFEHSHLYRLWLAKTAGEDKEGRSAITAEARGALARLREVVRADEAKLSVIVLPPMQPREDWAADAARSYDAALRIAGELGLSAFGLAKPLATALEQGVDPCETPGDVAHPGPEVAAVFAAFLEERGLLGR